MFTGGNKYGVSCEILRKSFVLILWVREHSAENVDGSPLQLSLILWNVFRLGVGNS